MNPEAYFKDLTIELNAVKNRIRNLIGPDRHYPSDGAWKESVLRSAIRRYLPTSFRVGSGFIVTSEDVSTQVDILICEDSAPLLFCDGDFIITTADCVRAAIEVKTSLAPQTLNDALSKLDNISTMLRKRCLAFTPFLGLFCYNSMACNNRRVLDSLATHNNRLNYPIQSICLGSNDYIKFWHFNDPIRQDGEGRKLYNAWHSYNLSNMAPGYFLHNLIVSLFPHAADRAEDLWFPAEGKESSLDYIQIREDLN